MSENSKKEKRYKVLLLGDSTVGKTCFLKRYLDDTFQDVYLSTIGFDFKFKTVTLSNGNQIKLQIWDTVGEERYRTIAKSYYKGAHGIVLIYDITNKTSFKNIKKWISQIKEELSNKISIVLVANKIDMPERIVSEEDGKNLANSMNLQIFEASARDNINVSEAFQELAEDINNKCLTFGAKGTKLQKGDNEKKKCC